MTTLLLIGLGDLGGVILELIARAGLRLRVVVASRSAARGIARTNLARVGALAQGCDPDIRFVPLDLAQIDAVAHLVRRESPDLILSTATLQTWWWPDLLPPPQASLIKSAGFGVWLPVHLPLTVKLMQALRVADYKGLVLTAPFPDVVNCVLDRLGLAPTAGIGNLDEIVPKVRLLAADRLHAAYDRVSVRLVAHHALEGAAFGEPAIERPPYHLRIACDGDDVTDRVDAADLLFAPYPIPSGRAFHFLTAGSAVRLIGALLSEQETFIHAPAPNGLPGGYPVMASRAGVRVSLDGISLADAISINERSHRFDGIERIEADGTVVFVPAAARVLADALGYDCTRLPPEDVEPRARELMAKFEEYAARHGVDLGRIQ